MWIINIMKDEKYSESESDKIYKDTRNLNLQIKSTYNSEGK